MRIAFIDVPVEPQRGQLLSFTDAQRLDRYDLVLWRPAALPLLYPPERRPGMPEAVPLAQAERLVAMTRHWRAEFAAFVARGGTLAIIDPGPAALQLHTVQDLVEHRLDDAWHEAFASRTGAASGEVACEVGEPFKSFFNEAGSCFEAASRFAVEEGQTICVDAAEQLPCGTYLYRHPGRVLVLPGLRADAGAAQLGIMVAALEAMALKLGSASTSGFLPEELLLDDAQESPQRAALRERLADVIAQRRALQEQEASLRMQLADMAFLERLSSEDPGQAMAAAALVLHALGAYAQAGPAGSGSLMFDVGGEVGILVALPAQCTARDIEDALRQSATLWKRDASLDATPIPYFLHAGSEAASMPSALSGSELSRAYASRDRDAPRRWIEEARRPDGQAAE